MPESDEKTCPYCAETIKKAAVVCKHCGRDLAEPPPRQSPPVDDHLSEEMERRIEGLEQKDKDLHFRIMIAVVISIVFFIYGIGKATMEVAKRERESEYYDLSRTISQNRGEVEPDIKSRYLKLFKEFAFFSIGSYGRQEIEEHSAIRKIDKHLHEIWIDPMFWKSMSKINKMTRASSFCQYFYEFNENEIPYCIIKSYPDGAILASMYGFHALEEFY